jgi:hypothetical protein
MNTPFHIEFSKSNGDLHVHPQGDFDGASAWELLNLLHDQYRGQGSVIVDTSRLREIHPFGRLTFQRRLNLNQLPADRLSFTGEKGFELAPEGCKVIGAAGQHACRCNGNCKQCKCIGEVKSN